MLTLKNKEDIYDLLRLGFREGEKIPLASVALYLNNKKFSYQNYGYKKLKSLLKDLPFLSLEADEKNPKMSYVVLHSFEESKSQKKNPHLNPKFKKVLCETLLKKYQPGNRYPFDEVCRTLSKHDIDFRNFGFPSYEALLLDLKDILLLEKGKNKTKSVAFLPMKIKKIENEKGTQDNSSLPKPSVNCFFIPDNLLLSLKEVTQLGLDDNALTHLLMKDYANAYKNKLFRKKDDAYLFPLSFVSKDKEKLIASIKKAGKGAAYSFYLNFIGTDKEKAKDVLNSTIYFEDIDQSMEELAKLAREEKWCYHNSKDKYIILKIYLQYTFYRIINQNKLCKDSLSSFACFNTGLKTKDYEDIYGILIENKNKKISQPYLFQGFAISAMQGLGKVIIEHFNPLPKKATYFTSAEEVIFHSDCDVHTDIRHIILDNLERFPLPFLKSMVLPFREEKKLLDQIEKENSSYQKERLFSSLEKCIEKNDILFSLLKVSLEASIAKSIRMVNYDYRNALPSFFPTRNVMSLMLPLEFTSEDEVQALLLVEKTPSGNYQGQTILTLKQCYVNARLISPLENSFLDPSKIED